MPCCEEAIPQVESVGTFPRSCLCRCSRYVVCLHRVYLPNPREAGQLCCRYFCADRRLLLWRCWQRWLPRYLHHFPGAFRLSRWRMLPKAPALLEYLQFHLKFRLTGRCYRVTLFHRSSCCLGARLRAKDAKEVGNGHIIRWQEGNPHTHTGCLS